MAKINGINEVVTKDCMLGFFQQMAVMDPKFAHQVLFGGILCNSRIGEDCGTPLFGGACCWAMSVFSAMFNNGPVTVDSAIAFLNKLVSLDRDFMFELISRRVKCSSVIAEHPTIQAHEGEGQYSAGFLGILNGLFGAYESGPIAGSGPICAVYDDDSNLVRFGKTLDFCKEP